MRAPVAGTLHETVEDIAALVPERERILPFLAPVLPAGWERSDRHETQNGAGFRNRRNGLGVMVSGSCELDGKLWIHVSLSRKDRTPSYEDMALVKRLFLGTDRKAIQLFVTSAEHFNYHPYCLHLWHCVDGDGLPDFRFQGGV